MHQRSRLLQCYNKILEENSWKGNHPITHKSRYRLTTHIFVNCSAWMMGAQATVGGKVSSTHIQYPHISPVALGCHFASLCCPNIHWNEDSSMSQSQHEGKGFQILWWWQSCFRETGTSAYCERVAPLVLIWDRHMFHLQYLKSESYFI